MAVEEGTFLEETELQPLDALPESLQLYRAAAPGYAQSGWRNCWGQRASGLQKQREHLARETRPSRRACSRGGTGSSLGSTRGSLATIGRWSCRFPALTEWLALVKGAYFGWSE